MAYTGITTRDGRCAICKDDFPAGTLVYFDRTKSQGSHLAHKQCFDDLKAGRDKQKKTTGKTLSSEPLDPPF